MTAISKQHDVIAQLTPGGCAGLAHLSDDELLANTRRLVGKANQLLAALLLHLAEVEARGVHRTRRCASLYTYCIYELRFSEDAAARRSAAARLVKQFPPLFDAIAAGELHLTGLLMIGPHLTPENCAEVLGRAKFRTKKELGKLLRELNPLPRVPDRLEPLGPALPRALRRPTWEQYVTSLAPPVRELPVGERPHDWANDVDPAAAFEAREGAATDARAPDLVLDDEPTSEASLPVGPVPRDLPPITGPQHYQVQFSTVEEHAQLVERAKALLARSRPGVTLGQLHLDAMRLLVASLEKRKFAVTDRPRLHTPPKHRTQTVPRQHDGERFTPTRQRGETETGGRQALTATRQPGETETAQRQAVTAARQRDETETGGRQAVTAPHQRGGTAGHEHETLAPPRRSGEVDAAPRERSRYIPAAERREVFQRDAGRCTYVDARGERCCETRYLELHHLQAFARLGASIASNLTLRCAAHNALAAEEDFGAQLIVNRRDATRHEALAAQAGSRGSE
jgi:hypothetical protein